MTTLARSLPAALALAAFSFLTPATQAAPGSGGGHGGGFSGGHGGGYGGQRGSGYYHGGYRGGYWRGGYWGPRGYWGPGPFWGGLGLGLGVGAVVYSSGYYDGYRGPYYGDVYDSYASSPEVVAVPAPEGRIVRSGQPVPQAGRAVEPIFYPNNGQSAAVLESDRRDCNRWATTQASAMADASIFQRATYACMEGRGYTVR